MRGFIDFIREQGVVGFAVGFLMGGAVSKVVTSFINNIINPFLGIIFGATGDLAQMSWKFGSINVMWGSFVSALIDFTVIAVVVYFGVRILKLEKLDRKNN